MSPKKFFAGLLLLGGAAAATEQAWFVPQGNITINATLLPNAPFNWERDFRPVTLLAYAPDVLVVHPAVPAKTVAELIAQAKANPGKLAYASPGNGSSLHLIGELLKREAKIDLLHVPYKGTTQALHDLVGGQVQLMFGAVREKLAAQGLTAVSNAPAPFAAQIKRETAAWAGIIREANIKAD